MCNTLVNDSNKRCAGSLGKKKKENLVRATYRWVREEIHLVLWWKDSTIYDSTIYKSLIKDSTIYKTLTKGS